MPASATPLSPTRRELPAAAAVGGALSLLPGKVFASDQSDQIRPFKAKIPQDQLTELHRRIVATRWPDRELVEGSSRKGFSSTLRGLSRAIGRRITTGGNARRD